MVTSISPSWAALKASTFSWIVGSWASSHRDRVRLTGPSDVSPLSPPQPVRTDAERTRVSARSIAVIFLFITVLLFC